MTSPTEIGKAYLAYQTFNFKAKKNRLSEFELTRWLRVVKALAVGPRKPGPQTAKKQSKGSHFWTPQRRKAFMNTIAARKAANGAKHV